MKTKKLELTFEELRVLFVVIEDYKILNNIELDKESKSAFENLSEKVKELRKSKPFRY